MPFTGFGLAFVGSTPLFKSGNNRNLHLAGAAVCAVSELTWIILSGHWIIPLLLIPAAAGIQAKFGNRLFWFEAALFVSMYVTLFRIIF